MLTHFLVGMMVLSLIRVVVEVVGVEVVGVVVVVVEVVVVEVVVVMTPRYRGTAEEGLSHPEGADVLQLASFSDYSS